MYVFNLIFYLDKLLTYYKQTDSKPYKVTPVATPGYIYLYSEDGIYPKVPGGIKLTCERIGPLLLARTKQTLDRR
jgi:hypothetical protein